MMDQVDYNQSMSILVVETIEMPTEVLKKLTLNFVRHDSKVKSSSSIEVNWFADKSSSRRSVNIVIDDGS
jgi:hypothetical protein